MVKYESVIWFVQGKRSFKPIYQNLHVLVIEDGEKKKNHVMLAQAVYEILAPPPTHLWLSCHLTLLSWKLSHKNVSHQNEAL